MREELELDLFLADLRAWVLKMSDGDPNKTTWFRKLVCEAFPGFVFWSGSPRVYKELTPKKKNKMRRFHLVH